MTISNKEDPNTMTNSYTVSRTDDGSRTMTTNGYFIKLSDQAIQDCLQFLGIDIITHVSVVVEKWAPGTNQELKVHVTKTINDSSATHTIEIAKK